MSASIFDGRNLAPVNRQAADVISTGTHFIPNYKPDVRDQRVPYPVRPIPPSPTAKLTESIVGKRYGRMLVIGLARDVAHRWVVRCSCGTYSLRRFAVIRDPYWNNDCCSECAYISQKALQQASAAAGKQLKQSHLASNKRPGEMVQAPDALDQAALSQETYKALPRVQKKLLKMPKEERTRWYEQNRMENEARRRKQAEDAAATNGRYTLGEQLASALRQIK